MAVEDMAMPMPATTAMVGFWLNAQPIAVTAAMVPSTCAAPMPKIGRRMFHRRCGLSSSPTRKSSSTTPNSAKCSTASGLETSLSPHGPITMPAAR